MNIKFYIIYILYTLFSHLNYEVDATRDNIIPFRSIYRSMERQLQPTKLNIYGQREIENFENEKAEFPVYKSRKKKTMYTVKNNNELVSKSSIRKEEKTKRNKKRKKKAKYNKRFIKTTLKNIDSTMSNSKDSDTNNKPVDIIVHIKMND